MKPKRVLVFCDDRFHPAATVRVGLAPLAAGGAFVFDWIEDAAGWNPAVMRDYPVVLLAKSNQCSATDWAPWLVGATEDALGDYVRAGGLLVVVHSGTASYQDWPKVRAVLGGVFIHHPPPCAVTVEPVPGHALTRGVEGRFEVWDEHYHLEMDDLGADVFLRAESEHGTQPAGWIRREGAGQVVVLTPGHFPAVWQHPAFQTLLRNALGGERYFMAR